MGLTRVPLIAASCLAAAALVLAQAGAAAAHVTVTSPDSTPGDEGKLLFTVPSESESASTTAVRVTLPVAKPFAEVSAKPLPGWTVTMTERTLPKPITYEGFTLTKAVATVTWTAAKGQGLRPGEFDEFELLVGPFPEKATTLSLPALQTYSDGTTVSWDEPTPANGDEPDHPTPTLDLTAAPAATTKVPANDPSSADSVARWLGGVGLVLGASALGLALLTRRRRTP
jgi:uncharacterized protein YcnI